MTLYTCDWNSLKVEQAILEYFQPRNFHNSIMDVEIGKGPTNLYKVTITVEPVEL